MVFLKSNNFIGYTNITALRLRTLLGSVGRVLGGCWAGVGRCWTGVGRSWAVLDGCWAVLVSLSFVVSLAE